MPCSLLWWNCLCFGFCYCRYKMPVALVGLILCLALWDFFKFCSHRWGLEQYPLTRQWLIRVAQCGEQSFPIREILFCTKLNAIAYFWLCSWTRTRFFHWQSTWHTMKKSHWSFACLYFFLLASTGFFFLGFSFKKVVFLLILLLLLGIINIQ